jgi:hypothetical protein
MKKFILFLMLAAFSVAGIAENRTGAIRSGFTMLSTPMTFSASDSIKTSETYTITITNPQKYLQHQTFTTTLAVISGSPSVAITAYGKVTSGGGWVQIGTPVTWTTTGNNPATITSAAPLNYNFLKVAYVCSGATQKVKVTAFDVRTANVFDIGSASAYVLGVATGTMAITSSDWAIGTTGIMTGIGAITADGLITGTAGATITGATTTGSIIVAQDTCQGSQTKAVGNKGVLRVTAACTLKGLSGGVAGQLLRILNTSNTTLVLKHNGSGTQKFMLSGAGDLTMTGQYNAVTLTYDGTYWFVTGKGQ